MRQLKKKKSLRKKEKLDIDIALEAKAVSAGLRVGDLVSRNVSELQLALKEHKEWVEAEIRSSAYQSALAKADETSKTLRLGQIPLAAVDDEEDELQIERVRKLALTKQEESSVKSGSQALATLASSTINESAADNQNSLGAESAQEKKIVFTEMEGFLALQQDEAQDPDAKHVFDDVPNT